MFIFIKTVGHKVIKYPSYLKKMKM